MLGIPTLTFGCYLSSFFRFHLAFDFFCHFSSVFILRAVESS